MNVLLINQLLIDFYSCIMIIATYSVNLANIYHSGMSGYFLCLLLSGELLMWIGLNSSVISLVVVTLERYIKVVHPVWHKNHFEKWMVYIGCAFPWVSGIIGNFFPYLFGTYVSDGQCMPAMQFPSQSGQLAYIWFTYLYFFQLPLLIFVVCYVRIFQVIRRQNRIFQQTSANAAAVFSSSATDAATVSHRAWRSQMSAVKTMTFITIFFAVSWLPNSIYFVVQVTVNLTFIWPLWYATLFIALFNICANPFIYIVSYDDVRIYLSRKLSGLLNNFRGSAVTKHTVFITAIVSENMQTIH
jgi:hypothetical protein